MTVLTSVILVVAILIIAAAIAYYLQKDQPAMKDFISVVEQVQDLAVEVKQTPQPSEELTTQAPLQVDAIEKVANLEPATPRKKKYYPKKPKTQI